MLASKRMLEEAEEKAVEETGEYACDGCGAVVKEDDAECPKCGMVFEEEEEEKEEEEEDDEEVAEEEDIK
ncbi:unnamed protein product [marine sediment metagenome]|uniref:Zinc-ribbon domain-containing protein n=1 Tax=marine sediment metagenome TaxID=412755 RepID=X0VG82_9ZZZZ